MTFVVVVIVVVVVFAAKSFRLAEQSQRRERD